MLIVIIIILIAVLIFLAYKLYKLELSGRAMNIIMRKNDLYPSDKEIEEALLQASKEMLKF